MGRIYTLPAHSVVMATSRAFKEYWTETNRTCQYIRASFAFVFLLLLLFSFFKSFNVEVILTLISYAIANHLTKQVCRLTSHLYGNCLCWLALLLKSLSSQFLCICGCVMYWTSRECKNVRIPLLLHIVSQLIQTKQSLVSVESNQSQ